MFEKTIIKAGLLLAVLTLIVLPALATDGPNVAAREKDAQTQSVEVQITAKGFEPDSFQLKPGVPARITFVRKTDDTCATEVVIPDYKIKRALPLNEPVTVELTPQKSGPFTFKCGMGMRHGRVIVQ